VPGRLKLALVSSWLWLDGEYVAPLRDVDHAALYAKLRNHCAAAGRFPAPIGGIVTVQYPIMLQPG
jgi:hypothetical protein